MVPVILGTLMGALAASPPTLRFATSYGDNMVLQRAPQAAVVWGWCANPPCSVTVHLDGTPATLAPVAVPGTWIAKLPATQGGPTTHTVTVSEGAAQVKISNVLFGDVWVCSGQSNMAFLLENSFNGSELVADADNHPLIRLFTSKKLKSNTPFVEQPMVEEPWTVSSRKSVSDDGCPHCNSSTTKSTWGTGLGDDNWLYMSAVCYLYGREIQSRTNMPVGLVNTNWGGTPLEFWSSADSLNKCAKSSGESGGAFNAMITPLLNMTIYGAIWYQGEANQGDLFTETDPQGLPMMSYGCRFPAMIADWREKWHTGSLGETNADFYFGFVSLAPWIQSSNGPAAVRWGLTAGYGVVPNAALPNVFDAIAIDLTDRTSPYGSVHIRDKTTVGNRLAAAGSAVAYGNKNEYWQGPVVSSATGTKSDSSSTMVSVTFTNLGGSSLQLMNTTGWEACTLVPSAVTLSADAANCTITNTTSPAPVSIGEWTTVTPSLEGDNTVTLSVQTVPNGGKVVVRYAWAAAPYEYKQASLYAAGYPAGPFIAVVTST